jgi:hypothetical protein
VIEMPKRVEILPSRNYGIVIKVSVPITFYWHTDNTFDGISIETHGDLDTKENIAFNRIMELIKPLIGKRR